eukprot:SAG22_NODE_95_length_20791_cov_40.318514_8_plen_69_part_00
MVNVKYTVNEIGRLDITVIGERKGGSYSEPCTVQSYMWRPVKAGGKARNYSKGVDRIVCYWYSIEKML